jgi:hypothetical protein
MLTEKQMINSVKVFQGNCLLNGDKISFADACKVVLLSKLVDQERNFTNPEMEILLLLVQGRKKVWYKFW